MLTPRSEMDPSLRPPAAALEARSNSPNPAVCRLVLAEDHPIFRKGLAEIIESNPSNRIVGQVTDGASLVRMVQGLQPDIAVVDIELPVLNGLDAARQLQAEGLHTALIFMTMHKSQDMLNEALDLGAWGYVVKDGAMEEILLAIQTTLSRHHYVSPSISEHLFARAQRRQAVARQLSRLTMAERRVLRLVSEFKSSKEIAAELGLSPRTVEHHRANLSARIGLQGAQSLAKFAYQNRFWL